MIHKANIESLLRNLPPSVKLVAVSKFKPAEEILEAYKEGIKDFGENRPQELKWKMDELPDDINWHFIGHLQTNKIKMIIDKVHMIHSVDSMRLFSEINREALKRGITVNCLLQVYIAAEDTKQGLSQEELNEILSVRENYGSVRICGLMGMASFTENQEVVRAEFRHLKNVFESAKSEYFGSDNNFCNISMGMSGDYSIAVEEGSTIVRIGSLIFGER